MLLARQQEADRKSSQYANCRIYHSQTSNSGGTGLVVQTPAVRQTDSLEPQVKTLAGSAEMSSFPTQLEASHRLSGWINLSSSSKCCLRPFTFSHSGERIAIGKTELNHSFISPERMQPCHFLLLYKHSKSQLPEYVLGFLFWCHALLILLGNGRMRLVSAVDGKLRHLPLKPRYMGNRTNVILACITQQEHARVYDRGDNPLDPTSYHLFWVFCVFNHS